MLFKIFEFKLFKFNRFDIESKFSSHLNMSNKSLMSVDLTVSSNEIPTC